VDHAEAEVRPPASPPLADDLRFAGVAERLQVPDRCRCAVGSEPVRVEHCGDQLLPEGPRRPGDPEHRRSDLHELVPAQHPGDLMIGQPDPAELIPMHDAVLLPGEVRHLPSSSVVPHDRTSV
jgi:hypothetical protein